MIYLQSFLDKFLKTFIAGFALLYIAACLPQGGKEERVKKSHSKAAHQHEEKKKEADANPLKDCEEVADEKSELLITEDDHNDEDHDHDEEEVVEAKKTEVTKEECKKKVTTEAKKEEHDHDHE